MASAKVSGHTPKRLHPVGKLEGAWEMEQKRSLREIERERERDRESEIVKEDMKKEIARREERKKRVTLRAQPAARTPFRGKETASALKVQWLVVDFNAYSKWQTKQKKTFREREATSVHLQQLVPAFRWKQVGFYTESAKVCSFCLLLKRVFSPLRGWVVVPWREWSVGPLSGTQRNSNNHAAVPY